MKVRTLIGLTLIIINLITIFGIYPTNTLVNLSITRAEVQAVPIESQDIIMNISQNASAIGPNSVVEYSVELTNNISESLYNISTNVSEIPSDLQITPAIDPLFTISSLDPESSTSFQFITEYLGGNGSYTTVDLALLIDASGSMQDEIDSVKAELTALTTNLTTEIPDIRFGVIVFGSSIYSEYPMSSSKNYVPFTNDTIRIKNFIDFWYAGGGIEPWGDALYLANSWDWRESASKLIILVGDEDCDPGMIIGNELMESDPKGTYNGSDLVDLVTELKNKEVIISTVICDGANAMTENQFQWIAEYTEGTSVFLPELESEGISLPGIIQEWTLELGRELFREIVMNITWQDGSSSDYFQIQNVSLWIDFSSPSAIISETISPTGPNLFSVDFLINIKDVSPIAYANLYHNAYGSWRVEFLSLIENTTYFRIELENVPGETNLSYRVECSDILRNVATTQLYWVIIETKVDQVGEEVALLAEANEKKFSNLKVGQGDNYYFILSGPADIDQINMTLVNLSSNETMNSSLSSYLNLSTSYTHKITKFDLDSGNYSIEISFPSNISSFTMSYAWIIFEGPSLGNFFRSMTDTIRVHGVEWLAQNGTFFSFNNPSNSPLVLRAEVYNSSFGLVDTFTVNSDLMVPKTDTYFIIIWATLRTGEFIVRNTDSKPTISTDVYYTTLMTTIANTNIRNATSFPDFFMMMIMMITIVIFNKKRKKKE